MDFFDIGSTLVDESKAYEHRIKDTIKNSSVTYERFYNLMIDFAKQGRNSYNEAVKYFWLQRTVWHSEDEFLYPETESCLQALSEKYKIYKLGFAIDRGKYCKARFANIPACP